MVEENKKPEEEKESWSKNLPLPNARVVSLIKKGLGGKRKIIKKEVKVGMNNLLASICQDISNKMAEKPYAYMDYEIFKQAAKPFLRVKELEKDVERIKISLEKIKADCDILIRDLDQRYLEAQKPLY